MLTNHDKELPVLPTKQCKAVARLLQLLILSVPAINAVLFYLFDGWMLAIFGLLLGLLIQNIIRSKLRTNALPSHQKEFDFTDYELSSWVLFRFYCL